MCTFSVLSQGKWIKILKGDFSLPATGLITIREKACCCERNGMLLFAQQAHDLANEEHGGSDEEDEEPVAEGKGHDIEHGTT